MPSDPDVLATPDTSTLTVLPWRPDLAWLACDLSISGKEGAHPQCPRSALKEQIRRLKAQHAVQLKTGVELEFQ